MACNCLKQSLDPRLETEDRLQPSEHQILITRPVVSDKGLGLSAMQKIIATKTESSETSKVFIRR